MMHLIAALLLSASIEDLGSPNYRIREKARQELLASDTTTEIRIAKNHADPEIRLSAEYIEGGINDFIQWVDISIWYLPSDQRFVDGEDIAELFHSLAESEQKYVGLYDDIENEMLYTGFYPNDKLAMKLFCQVWMRNGGSKKELIQLLTRMTDLSHRTAEARSKYNWWVEHDPKTPIEERIRKIEDDQFTIPSD